MSSILRKDPSRTIKIQKKAVAKVDARFAEFVVDIKASPSFLMDDLFFADVPEMESIELILHEMRTKMPILDTSFIRDAYVRGVQTSIQRLASSKLIVDPRTNTFFSASHRADQSKDLERLNKLKLENRTAYDGIRETMISATAAVLVTPGPLTEKKEEVADRILKIGATRTRNLVRSMAVKAAHQGQTSEFTFYNVDLVSIIVEEGKEGVCARCLHLKDKVFSLRDAEQLLPVHIGCRCSMKPEHILDTNSDIIIDTEFTSQ